MNVKKIMILGASVYQVPLIKTAKRMGLYTIVSSIAGNYPGFSYADKVYYIDTTDKEAILDICQKEGIDGICTSGTDVAVATIGYVNEKMGLSGISEKAAERACNKYAMKSAFKEGGVSASGFIKATSLEEAKRAASVIGYPVVVKCVDSSGSRGISAVNEEKDLEAAYDQAIGYSRQNYVLIEEMLGGVEIGVDGLVKDGEVVLFAPHHKYTYKYKGITIPAGHSFPYRCSEKVYSEINHQITLAVKALGIDNSAFNSDVFVDGECVYIIEMGGRAGATGIPELISMHYGFDFYEKMLMNALGEDMGLPTEFKSQPCMSKLLMSPVDGVISKIDHDAIERIKTKGYEISLDYSAGQSVEEMHNGTTRIGQIIATNDDEEVVNAAMDEVYDAIYIGEESMRSLWKK